MASVSESQLPPPKNWDAFEEMCADIFEREWQYRNTVRYGRQGQRQNGVDIYGRPNGRNVGVQCKGKRQWPPTDLSAGEVDREVAEALKFKPELDELIFATTAPSDVRIQDHVRMISESNIEQNLFSVHVLSWEELIRRLTRYDDLIRKHFNFHSIGNIESKLDEIPGKIIEGFSFAKFVPSSIIDDEIFNRLERLRRCRFFSEFDHKGEAKRLSHELREGELQLGSSHSRNRALSWCARILAGSDLARAKRILSEVQEDSSDEEKIARAFLKAEDGKVDDALHDLSQVASAGSKSAAFHIISNQRGPKEGFDWLRHVGLKFSDMDPEGKFYYLSRCHEVEFWTAALEAVADVNDSDFEDTPVLYFAVAATFLAQAVPEEFRGLVIQEIPFDVRNFPLSTELQSLVHIRAARANFDLGAQCAASLGLDGAAANADAYSLWLELRDPESHPHGLERLKSHMREHESSLRLVNFGLQYGLELDRDAVTREIDRQTALTGGNSVDAALARFALAFTHESEAEVAEYIDRHRSQLEKHLNYTFVARIEIEMLARSGRIQDAEERLDSFRSKGADERIASQLDRILSEAKGGDPVSARIEEYEHAPSLSNLGTLVGILEAREDWERVTRYALLLHEKVKSVDTAARLAHSLYEQSRLGELRELLEGNIEFIQQSEFLKSLWCSVLYHVGEISKARKILSELRSACDRPKYRKLEVNIAISSGDWESLSAYVEGEWIQNDDRTPEELLRIAHVAHLIQSPRVKDILQKMTSREVYDPAIFLGAYQIAVNEGWEKEESVAHWFSQAVHLSGDDGPVRSMSLEEVVRGRPGWKEHESNTWERFGRGEIPIFGAALALNKTLGDFILIPAIANKREGDVRRRSLIRAYSPSRKPVADEPKIVGLDATALLTLSILGLVDSTLEAFEEVRIPHTTLNWLLIERERIQFHQPSRIRDALEVRDLIHGGYLQKFQSAGSANPNLVAEVGTELAALISEAESSGGEDASQRLVIRPYPVHRIGSLMEEVVDLGEHARVMCSCSAVVEKMKANGLLSAAEASTAQAYLTGNEDRWPTEPEIDDCPVLYLDNLAVMHFQRLGLLSRFRTAGMKVVVSPLEVDEIDALLRYHDFAGIASSKIDELRRRLASAIREGRIKLGPLPFSRDDIKDNYRSHPTAAILDLVPFVDAAIVDDPFLNKHSHLQHDHMEIPTLTTLDLMNLLESKGVITEPQKWDFRTSLRQAGFSAVPLTTEELTYHLESTISVDGRLRESAELKAIRESLLHMEMSRALNLPADAQWLLSSQRALIDALFAQWNSSDVPTSAAPRSDWIAERLDFRAWASCYPFEMGARFGNASLCVRAMSLLRPNGGALESVQNEYWEWFKSKIIAPLEVMNPDVYEEFMGYIESTIVDVVNADISEIIDADG